MLTYDAFLDSCRQRHLFPEEGCRVIVACSGGVDSQVLLHGLWWARHALRLDLFVLTCDHGLRPESAKEAAEVRLLAWRLGLPCRLESLRVPRNRKPGESVEMAARRLRREAFLRTALQVGATHVAVGHHRDDQAETLVLRLCRGTGLDGAAGMAPRAPLAEGVDIVRPLLPFTRADIEALARSWRLRPIEDSSNSSPSHLRNRVRHTVLPLLSRELNPAVSAHLAAFAEEAREIAAHLAAETACALQRCSDPEGLDIAAWRQLPPVIRIRALRDWLQARGARAETLDRGALHKLQAWLMDSASQRSRRECAGLPLLLSEGRMRLFEPIPHFETLYLPLPGAVYWPGLGRVISLQPAHTVDRVASSRRDFRGLLCAFLRAPRAGEPLVVRPPRAGDRYRPLGLKGTAKLSDLFINARLPVGLRPRWPVLACGDEIVWVPGFRVAESWRMGTEGGCVARLEPDHKIPAGV